MEKEHAHVTCGGCQAGGWEEGFPCELQGYQVGEWGESLSCEPWVCQAGGREARMPCEPQGCQASGGMQARCVSCGGVRQENGK